MPRGLSATQKTALQSRIRAACYFVELSITAPVRVWTGLGTITALGNSWIGLGELGVISGMESDLALKAQSISVSLVGIPGDAITPGMVASTRGERYQGAPLKVYFGMTNPDTGVLLDAPIAVWSGLADVLSFRRGATITCTLTGEHVSSRLRQSNGARMTTQSHNERLGNATATDLFFEPQTRFSGVPRAIIP
jgi:hypothetical protein